MATSIATIARAAQPLAGDAADYDRLLERVGTKDVVCIGEASHGTHEFYFERAEITKRLVAEHGFEAVVAEADWPDAYSVNRYVRGAGTDRSGVAALAGFRRFPQWMWRNTVVVDFVDWLRLHNARAGDHARHAGFYGMDLYSLHASIDSVLHYLDGVDPEAARRARTRYACFDHFGGDPQSYGYLAGRGVETCEDAVVKQLVELQRSAREYVAADGIVDGEDAFFSAEQNAHVVKNAEEYYRAMFRGRVSSWNLRDGHMVETLGRIGDHLKGLGRRGKLVVWAHNSHLGDASFTEMGRRQREHNVGQLVRQRWGRDRVALVGFTTHAGTVSAADDWDEPVQRKTVRPSLAGSVERLFHDVREAAGHDRFLVSMADDAVRRALREPLLERAIGVIYRPETERQSHYFHCHVADQFDEVIHIEETRAVEPLERNPVWEEGEEVPETYPSGI